MYNYLILTIGIPASGKTTTIAKLYKNATIVSPDNFIGYNKQDPWTPKIAKKAWKKADKLLKEELKKKTEVIIFDATFVRPKVRKKYIKLAKKYNFIPIALYCYVPFNIAQDRNLKREDNRRVPKSVLLNMNNNLIPPSYDEGFEKILTINTY